MPTIDVSTLAASHVAAQAQAQQRAAAAYDPDAAHRGCWYEIRNTATLFPTPVAIVQSKGPGDALRFLHAATCLLNIVHSYQATATRMMAFIEEGYAKHIVGLYSGANIDPSQQDNNYIVYLEDIGNGRAIQWIVLRNQPFSGDAVSTGQFRAFVNLVLQYLGNHNYRWYSPNGAKPVLLEPYNGKTRHHAYPGVQFARIDLNLDYMEGGSFLRIPHTTRAMRARPPNTLRVLLYLRLQQGEDRNTPWFHLEFLRSYQVQLAAPKAPLHGPKPPAIRVQVTLAGMKNQSDYLAALAEIAPANVKNTIASTILFDWGWDTYCYTDHSYRQQLAAIDGRFDIAIGVNTSALDLAAAAGSIVLRDKEWKQGEYQGSYYNLFLLTEATYGVFAFTEPDRKALFDSCLDHVLREFDSLPRRYIALTMEKYYGQPLGPTEKVIGSLQ